MFGDNSWITTAALFGDQVEAKEKHDLLYLMQCQI